MGCAVFNSVSLFISDSMGETRGGEGSVVGN